MNKIDVKNWNIYGNELNLISPSERTNHVISQSSKDKSHDSFKQINWELETQYHNTYYLGNGRYGRREIRAKKV